MAVIEINHPLIQHKLTIMRSIDTDTKSFRENLNEIAKLMTYEATKNLKLQDKEVTTPLMTTTGCEL
ncbi:uracil phosphoribosyltransferase, partial [Fusobacterium perfoetens]|uniref:uracil phosphoribosyltransferase n=1 Tax=Fusobacterium perfoetens TaxID=852 RepID=UPI0026ECCD1E